MVNKSDKAKSGICWSSFVAGMLMIAVLAAFTLPFVVEEQVSKQLSSEVPSVDVDYKRLEVSADRIERAAKTIADTERAWEILAAKIVLDYETNTAAAQRVRERQNEETSRRLEAATATRQSSPGGFVEASPRVTGPWSGYQSSSRPSVAENGSWRGQPNANGVPKTVYVRGYYRKDGTYVQGHYRSRPNSNP